MDNDKFKSLHMDELQKAVWVLKHMGRGQNVQVKEVTMATNTTRPTLYKYRDTPELMKPEMIQGLADFYDITWEEGIPGQLKRLRSEQQLFEETRQEVRLVINHAADLTDITPYTQLVLHALDDELAKPGSLILKVLMDQI